MSNLIGNLEDYNKIWVFFSSSFQNSKIMAVECDRLTEAIDTICRFMMKVLYWAGPFRRPRTCFMFSLHHRQISTRYVASRQHICLQLKRETCVMIPAKRMRFFLLEKNYTVVSGWHCTLLSFLSPPLKLTTSYETAWHLILISTNCCIFAMIEQKFFFNTNPLRKIWFLPWSWGCLSNNPN